MLFHIHPFKLIFARRKKRIRIDKKNKKLGAMAFQNFICADRSVLVVVYDPIRGSLVFHTKQSQTNFWGNGW